jgi:hypothetical protein
VANTLTAVEGYRNSDAGYGSGLEPDLRSVVSQPVGAMHAMEVFAEAAPITTPRAVELCDWLHRQTLDDGGLPFALPVEDPGGSSPIWTSGDPSSSSLQMTSQVAAHAHRLASHHPGIDEHPWLDAATRYCLDAIGEMDDAPPAHALMFSVRFLDAAAPRVPEVDAALDRLARHVPADGAVPVQGGVAGEKLNLLDLSPGPVRLRDGSSTSRSSRRISPDSLACNSPTADGPSTSRPRRPPPRSNGAATRRSRPSPSCARIECDARAGAPERVQSSAI